MKIVIIGAGPAGVNVVETLRTHDRESEIVVLTNEPFPPYSPPAMVDHFLTGSDLHFWRGKDWHEQFGVDYRSGQEVVRLDGENRQLELRKGKPISYDKLVIASGSRLHAPLEGAELAGVYNFKSLSAAEDLFSQVQKGKAKTALIIGAGFIGMEIALLLRQLNVEVTQVEMFDHVMPAMLDPQTAEFALTEMQARGVQVHLNTKAAAFEGEKKISGVRLANGDLLQADIYIAATGVRPNTDFLQETDMDVDWGIRVDDHMQTNLPEVYAAGDVAETKHRLTGKRYVHAIFPNAVEQGKVVGLNLAGFDRAYEGADRMNSLKHLDLPIIAVGNKEGDEQLSARINGGRRTIYLQNDRIVGFQLVGDVSPAGVLRTLMNRGDKVKGLKDRLLEPGFGEGMLAWSAVGAPAV